MDVARVEAAERELDAFINRRAKGAEKANAEAEFWRARDERQTKARRLANAREWAEHFGALALYFHDQAAANAQKRDRFSAIVRDLQGTNDKGDAA